MKEDREIKFRAWDKSEKEMRPVTKILLIPEPMVELGGKLYNYPLMQYTGIKDKRGKEIYEGDIVKSKWGGQGYIEFNDGAFEYVFEDGKFRIIVSKINTEKREIEIIGNIYESKHLLVKIK